MADGHQDAVKPFETLTAWEQANYSAHKYAKDALRDYVTDECPPIPTTIGEGDTWLLTLDAVPVTSEIKKTIYNSKYNDEGKSFWMVRLQIRYDQCNIIEWDIVRRTSVMCSGEQRKRRTKHMANIGPVGTVLHRRKARDIDMCARCKMEETKIHIVTCQGPDTEQKFLTAMETVDDWMRTGPNQFAIAIRELLRAHRNRTRPRWHLVDDEDTIQTMKQQWSLSKVSLLWGFLHTGWRPIIDRHFKGSRKSSARWLSILCGRIWGITEQLWEHRNTIEHGVDANNHLAEERHSELNEQIDAIFDRVPALRYLPLTSRHFFTQNKAWRKRCKLRDKRKWIRDADVVLKRYEEIRNLSHTARNFENFLISPSAQHGNNDDDD